MLPSKEATKTNYNWRSNSTTLTGSVVPCVANAWDYLHELEQREVVVSFRSLKCSILQCRLPSTLLLAQVLGGRKRRLNKIIDKDIKCARVSPDTYLLTLQVAAGAGAAEA